VKSGGGKAVAAVRDVGEQPAVADLIGSVKVMLDAFSAGKIDRLYLVGNEFVNTMTQTPNVQQLLPLKADETVKRQYQWDYLYEPDAQVLLDGLLVRYIESQVYQAVVENGAAEQAARMVVVTSVIDSAGELIGVLQLACNCSREAAITQELAEVVCVAAAV